MNSVYFPLKSSQTLLKEFDPTNAEVTNLFREIRKIQSNFPPPTLHTKSISKHLLSNGLSVGEFCLWYINSDRVMRKSKCRSKNK